MNDDDDRDLLPWCTECEKFAAPTDDGECGECGTPVVVR